MRMTSPGWDCSSADTKPRRLWRARSWLMARGSRVERGGHLLTVHVDLRPARPVAASRSLGGYFEHAQPVQLHRGKRLAIGKEILKQPRPLLGRAVVPFDHEVVDPAIKWTRERFGDRDLQVGEFQV